MGLNKCMFIGRLGQDPEKRITPAGHSVTNISLAVSEYRKDASGQRQETVEWIRVVFWNRLAEIVEQYCKKGSQIFVEGKYQTREWQDKDGNRRFSTDIVGKNIQLLDSRQSGNNQQRNYQGNSYQQGQPGPNQYQNHQSPPQNGAPAYQDDDFIEDDIPF